MDRDEYTSSAEVSAECRARDLPAISTVAGNTTAGTCTRARRKVFVIALYGGCDLSVDMEYLQVDASQ